MKRAILSCSAVIVVVVFTCVFLFRAKQPEHSAQAPSPVPSVNQPVVPQTVGATPPGIMHDGIDQIKSEIQKARLLPASQARLTSLTSLFLEYEKLDPKGAIDFAQNNLTADDLDSIFPMLLSTWAGREPQASIEWFLVHQNDSTFTSGRYFAARDQLLQTAFSAFAADPTTALNLAQQINDDGVRQSVLTPIATAAVQNGHEEQILRATQELDASTRLSMASSVFSQWAALDLPAATQAYTALLSRDEQRALASSIGVAWMQVDPAAAANWWLNTSSSSDEAIIGITNTWQSIDATSSENWLQTLPEASQRDTARNAMANQMFNSDSERAIAIASTIEDPERRGQVWSFLIRLLQAQNPNLAASLVNAAPLELRNSLQPSSQK